MIYDNDDPYLVVAADTETAINGSGIRDKVRVLKLGINTVIRTLKNLVLETVNHSINTTEVIIAYKIDELWSYVQNKTKQQ